jgi:hypothetical protein
MASFSLKNPRSARVRPMDLYFYLRIWLTARRIRMKCFPSLPVGQCFQRALRSCKLISLRGRSIGAIHPKEENH